jgi:CRISPR/Cas system CMR-associated protein Cmr1 (group 7 of RAMP superfamily)
MSTLKTGKVKTTTIADELDTESTAVTNVINGSAKAWVNFNGIGTVAIRRGFNVSSITDIAVGQFTLNFTTAMADGNYAVVIGSDAQVANTLGNRVVSTSLTTTTNVRVLHLENTAYQDPAIMNVVIFS